MNQFKQVKPTDFNNTNYNTTISEFRELVDGKVVFFHPTALEAIKIHKIHESDILSHPYFNYVVVDGTVFIITGFSKTNSSISSALFFSNYKPKMAVLAGIAGAYAQTDLNIGDVVSVKTEYFVDESHINEKSIEMLNEINLEITPNNKIDFKTIDDLKIVNSNTISLIPTYNNLSDLYYNKTLADIENMEGASFAAAASKFTSEFYEVRAISNYCGEKASQKWDIVNSSKNLKNEINNIIEKYK